MSAVFPLILFFSEMSKEEIVKATDAYIEVEAISPHYVARGRQIAALGLPLENVRPLTVAAGNGQTDAVKLAV